MANYLMKYKGKYRILPELDKETNDFVRDELGNISEDHIYIDCQHGNTISTYGHINGSRAVYLTAYIPSLGRGRNVKKELDKQEIEYVQYIEGDEEVKFEFKALDIEPVATLLKARTFGCNISPFSVKNLKKRTDIVIPEEKIDEYKNIVGLVDRKDLLIISRITEQFLLTVVQRTLRKTLKDRKFDVKQDMRKLMLARQTKEYIWSKNMFDEYLVYLKKEINKYYNK